jgi:hypothetical protein
MSIIKFALLGAAVAYGINELTRKRANGTSILDDLTQQAPEWMDKAKQFANQTVDQVKESVNPNPSFQNDQAM